MAQAAAARRAVRARRRDDALRHRRRARRRLLRRAARALRGLGAAAARAPPGPILSTRPTAPRRCATPASHFDLVRAGVAIYGLDPFQEEPAARELEPALELAHYVAAVKPLRAGRERGLRPALRRPRRDTVLATVPIGYGDGVRRALTNNAERAGRRPALPAGRHRVAWTTSPSTSAPTAAACRVGDEAAARSAPGIPAEEIARRLGTINYEVTCALTAARAARAPPRRGAGVIETLARGAGRRARVARGRRAARPPARPPDARPRRRRRRRRRAAPRAAWRAAPAARRSSCRSVRRLARRRAATAAWQVDLTPLQGGDARGRPRRARLDGQRDGRAAARRRARRSPRRRARPRRAAAADGRAEAFADDPLRVAARRRAWPASWASRSSRRPRRRRARTRAGLAGVAPERVFAELRADRRAPTRPRAASR